MNDEVLLGFLKEVQAAARVLQEVTRAFKINYEIHGNTMPHLHMHLFPRDMDDPLAGVSIDYNQIEPPVFEGNEYDRFVRTMQKRLGGLDI